VGRKKQHPQPSNKGRRQAGTNHQPGTTPLSSVLIPCPSLQSSHISLLVQTCPPKFTFCFPSLTFMSLYREEHVCPVLYQTLHIFHSLIHPWGRERQHFWKGSKEFRSE